MDIYQLRTLVVVAREGSRQAREQTGSRQRAAGEAMPARGALSKTLDELKRAADREEEGRENVQHDRHGRREEARISRRLMAVASELNDAQHARDDGNGPAAR